MRAGFPQGHRLPIGGLVGVHATQRLRRWRVHAPLLRQRPHRRRLLQGPLRGRVRCHRDRALRSVRAVTMCWRGKVHPEPRLPRALRVHSFLAARESTRRCHPRVTRHPADTLRGQQVAEKRSPCDGTRGAVYPGHEDLFKRRRGPRARQCRVPHDGRKRRVHARRPGSSHHLDVLGSRGAARLDRRRSVGVGARRSRSDRNR